MSLILVIGNKTYSSWSLRAWLVMTRFGIDFDEILIPLDQADTKERILRHSPSGRVPCLIDGDVAIWDTLSIVEYLAERYPDAGIWPSNSFARAIARSVSAEMHSGFPAIREYCPMNLRKRFPFKDWGGAAAVDEVRRIEQLWSDCRARFAGAGPFLFGDFSAADAMFAPVVTRLDRYGWTVTEASRAYMDAVLAMPELKRWTDDAAMEPWVIEAEEVEPA
ncbi:glutathione S-transferase family protein [Amorphus orientalis]|uniref:Glutathione S-transferase n=1 Tax=Amorphus orientalis TaxID=649198 RepID=A0AAE3VPU1_9HYPH|nr:glutathione S-transferase family protein [Amorphus orientalis]MDQ0315935.1 glutathione S-transferase [Amorphus orientalis]